MIGPFDCWTTARSGDRAGGAGAASTALSVDALSEHPTSSVLTDAARIPRPKSLRLKVGRTSLLGASAVHVPQPVVWQLPHPLAGLLITLSNLSIDISPFGGHLLLHMPPAIHRLRNRKFDFSLASGEWQTPPRVETINSVSNWKRT